MQTQINAIVVADSQNIQGDRITTMLVTFPRFILAELNTHRMFSKNSASSRAIPFKTMLENVQNNPFVPIAFQKEHKGMQGSEYCTSDLEIEANKTIWLRARDKAVQEAINLNQECNVTKQLCNRLLEPFMWHTVLITATEWENFFALRCPNYGEGFRSKKDYAFDLSIGTEENYWDSWTDLDWLKANKGQSEIHMMALAEAMWDAMNESTPKQLQPEEWHIPFEDKIEVPEKSIADWSMYKIKVSTAMCARTSYTVVGDEKEFTHTKQLELFDKLATSNHLSPFEHCAKAMTEEEYYTELNWSKNFRGFIQYRKILENGINRN